MMLRRFTQNIKEQNWFTVGIDTVVLVVGIFLGMQASNWNEARLERQEEKATLAAIRDELRSNEPHLEQLITFNGQYIDAANFILKALNSPSDTIDMDKLYHAFGQTMNLTSTILDTSVFNEIVASGRLQLIQDSELKLTITNFYSQVMVNERIEDRGQFRHWFFNYLPFMFQNVDIGRTQSAWASQLTAQGYADLSEYSPYDAELPVSDLWSLPKTDPRKHQAINMMNYNYTEHFYARAVQRDLLEQSRQLVNLIDQAIMQEN